VTPLKPGADIQCSISEMASGTSCIAVRPGRRSGRVLGDSLSQHLVAVARDGQRGLRVELVLPESSVHGDYVDVDLETVQVGHVLLG